MQTKFEEPNMRNNQQKEEEWEIWHQDNFDPDTPRQVISTGEGLINGLTKLWIWHLYETVQKDGFISFSKYNLWFKQPKRSIQVIGDIAGQKKLRKWLFGDEISGISSSKDAVDQHLLDIILKVHLLLLKEGKTSEIIIERASKSDNRYQFEKLLKKLLKSPIDS